MSRCFYCLDPKISISVCLDCRTRLELAEAEIKRLKQDMTIRHAQWSKKMREATKTQRPAR